MINASLGAHYSNQFVSTSIKWWWQTLFGKVDTKAKIELTERLSSEFGGQAVLVYKGRDAIELALRGYGFTNSTDVILTQAFTCYAIEEAIVRAGAKPVYVDLGDSQLNLNVKTLETARKKHGKKIKAVIVQNTLGHPAEMRKIHEWCRENKICLIEDLAQSFGALDEIQTVGMFGDATVLSFGRDKVIDAVSGGAVVFRTKPTQALPTLAQPAKFVILKDLAYPFLTWLIRGSFDWGLGKLIHKFLTLVGLMGNPTQAPTTQMTNLPPAFADLALGQLSQTSAHRQHRREVAALYLKGLADTPVKLLTKTEHLKTASLLRVAATVNNPASLLTWLKTNNIHLTDRWYRTPVDSGQLNSPTVYVDGSCPNAEKLAETIINLPTHSKITAQDAVKIIAAIQKFWQK